MTEEKEYIKWSAIKTINTAVDTEKIFTGYCHSTIRDTIKAYNEDGSHFKEIEAGFVTNKGKFVNRADAHEIAFGKCGYLESWMLYDDPKYGKK